MVRCLRRFRRANQNVQTGKNPTALLEGFRLPLVRIGIIVTLHTEYQQKYYCPSSFLFLSFPFFHPYSSSFLILCIHDATNMQ